jgi:hypothetical protein
MRMMRRMSRGPPSPGVEAGDSEAAEAEAGSAWEAREELPCVQERGDLLYVPKDWDHAVWNEGEARRTRTLPQTLTCACSDIETNPHVTLTGGGSSVCGHSTRQGLKYRAMG